MSQKIHFKHKLNEIPFSVGLMINQHIYKEILHSEKRGKRSELWQENSYHRLCFEKVENIKMDVMTAVEDPGGILPGVHEDIAENLIEIEIYLL